MGLGNCYSCIKYMMFAFNFLFWLLGCTLIGLGIWVRVDKGFEKLLADDAAYNYLHTSAYVLITAGVVIMVIGFLGCCGAIRESQCLLATFFCCLFVLFGVLLTIGIWGIVARGSLKEYITERLNHSVANYKKSPAFMDHVEENLHCCGVEKGLQDYDDAGISNHKCQLRERHMGCASKLFDFVNEHIIIIAGVSIGIGIVMLFGMWFSCYLCCAIRRSEPGYSTVNQ